MKNKTLVRLTIAQLVLLVGVLAGYLVAIARTLRRVSETLARVTWGVRAIERQTEPLQATVRDVNADLAAVADGLDSSGDRSPGG